MQMNYAPKQSDQSYPEFHTSKKKRYPDFLDEQSEGGCDKNYTHNYAVLQHCIVFREQSIRPAWGANVSEHYSS
jgi:hypothetical protein